MIYFANPATSHGRNHGKVRRSKTGLVGSWEAATFDVTDETYAYSVRTRTFEARWFGDSFARLIVRACWCGWPVPDGHGGGGQARAAVGGARGYRLLPHPPRLLRAAEAVVLCTSIKANEQNPLIHS